MKSISLITFFLFHVHNLVSNLEISKSNCINGVTLFSNCSFDIDIHGIIENVINCTLQFKPSNNSLIFFINNELSLKSQSNNECPTFEINIVTSDQDNRKNNRLSTTCGGIIDPINKNFDRFVEAKFLYDNKKLIDNETIIKMKIELNLNGTKCMETKSKILRTYKNEMFTTRPDNEDFIKSDFFKILIGSSCGFIVLVVLLSLIIWKMCSKTRQYSEAPLRILTSDYG